MNEIIKLKPIFKQMIWGGNRMRREFGYSIPGEHTGECWAVSAHPNGDCEIAEGIYQGMKLSQLFQEHRELFGHIAGNRFPLLVKIIDAKEDLSIQVHPNDAYAQKYGNGSLGKTECWYVVDCEPKASIIIGHHAQTKEEMEKLIYENRWKELLREIPIHKGDFFQINPGCIHAIKGGTMILETQQSSDITYRLYDYDRIKDGKKRELHIEESLAVMEIPFRTEKEKEKGIYCRTRNTWFEQLNNCPFYTIWKADLCGKIKLIQDQPFLIGSVLDGSCRMGNSYFRKGEHFLVPKQIREIDLDGNASFIFSTVSKALHSIEKS